MRLAVPAGMRVCSTLTTPLPRGSQVLYVPLPPPDGRASILRALTRKVPVVPGLDLSQLAAGAGCEGFSGADMAALVREACVLALKVRRVWGCNRIASGSGKQGTGA